MENKPKKSKALIITLIVILILLLLGFLVYKYRDFFGTKTSNSIAKIFSPLLPSDNTKGIKIEAKAGGDIKKGDNVSLVNPIVMRATGDDVFGFAKSDIKYNSKGEIILNSGSVNTTSWTLIPRRGDWTLNPTTGEWVVSSNSGKWISPLGIPSQPAGGWSYDSNSKTWTLNPNADGGWVYSKSKGAWVSPGTVPPPPQGGWVYDSASKNWTMSETGGEWLFNPIKDAWGSPGDTSGNINNTTSWVLIPRGGEWTLNPTKGDWSFDSNSGKWLAPDGISSQPDGGWVYDSTSKTWTLNPNADGGWVYSTRGEWVSPGTVPPPPQGGWVYDSTSKSWTLSPNEGEWLFNPNTGEWGSPGGDNLLGNALIIIAQAGEDIKQGEAVSLVNPTVIKATPDSSVFGVANQDIQNEGVGQIIVSNSGTSNTFFDSFSRFLNNIFNINPSRESCANGANNYPMCTTNDNNLCLNGANNPPLCTTTSGGSCENGTVNHPLCTLTSSGSCLNGTTNPPLCTLTSGGLCQNGTVNPPLCTLTSGGLCQNGTVNPPLCTLTSSGSCLNGATNPELCNTTPSNSCLNGASNPPLCTLTSSGSCLNGTTNPPLCTTTSNGSCLNGAVNFPLCTINSNGNCLNGAINPDICTVGSDNKCLNGAIDPTLCRISPTNQCINGAVNPNLCTIKSDGSCVGGEINPPACTVNSDNKCSNGAIDPTLCHISPFDDRCINGATNPPVCTTTPGGCIGGEINPPACTVNPDNKCSNGATNPPQCNSFISETNNLPVVAVTASPSSVAPGASSTINWTSTNATTCNAGAGRGTGTSGTFNTGVLNDSKSFSVTCTGPNGTGSGNANVYINGGGGNNTFPTVSVKASPSSVAPGASSVINWTSTNATICDAGAETSSYSTSGYATSGSNRGTGTSGTFNTGALNDSKSFSVTCTGPLGSSSGFVNVFVNGGGGGPDKTIFQCNDKTDNDIDGRVDNQDPQCHLDGDLNKDYVENHDSESTPPKSNEADLKSGNVTPASSLVKAKVTLSANITNDGGDSTLKDFNSFFAITRNNPSSGSYSTSGYSTSGYTTSGYVTSGAGGNIELSANISMLSPGTTNIAKVAFTFTSGGTYYIRSCADKKSANDSGLIKESNENNNCGDWTTFTVTSSLPPPGDTCTNNAVNYPACTVGADGKCLNGATDPEACTNSRICTNKAVNYPECTVTSDGACINGATDPTACKKTETEANKCLLIEQNPLTFTDKEKAQLEILLRRFYLISSSLKTVEDISTIYNEIDQQKNFITQINTLTKQCYAQQNDNEGFTDFCSRNNSSCDTNIAGEYARIANTKYSFSTGVEKRTAHNTRHGNPWFTKKTGGVFPYTDGNDGYLDLNWLDDLLGADKVCTAVSGYYYGTTFKPTILNVTTIIPAGSSCEAFNNFSQYNQCWSGTGGKENANDDDHQPNARYLSAGCKWKDGVNLSDVEMVLKIW